VLFIAAKLLDLRYLLISYLKFIHGILDRMMLMLGVPLARIGSKDGYYIMESNSNFILIN
jgi:hypothetical protein